MESKKTYGKVWQLIYKIYPPLLRLLEKQGAHKGRQPFPIGFLNTLHSKETLETYLIEAGFENAILAWKDSEEILSMRKIDKDKFQYHIRLHLDGEIRGHYEYSSEGNPIGHIFEKVFLPEKDFFVALLKNFLK